MQPHPVPQPITSYEFRLIGSMTLKQFAKIAVCALVALFLYALPLPLFIKYPLMAVLILLGLGLAFVPINERPMDVWIGSFLKSLFSPTQFIWLRRPPNLPDTYSTAANLPLSPSAPASSATAQPQSNPFRQVLPKITDFDPSEKQLLENFKGFFTETPAFKPKVKIEPAIETRTQSIAAKMAQGGFLITPSQPNIIYGILKDKEGKLIDGAILEVKDSHGYVVRALRSNKLGQFRTATPLPNGGYEIATEKEGFDFDIINLNLEGGLAPAIEINPK